MRDIVDYVAKAMWDRTHDGSWDDEGDGQDESRKIYRDDAALAVKAMDEWRFEAAGFGVTSAKDKS